MADGPQKPQNHKRATDNTDNTDFGRGPTKGADDRAYRENVREEQRGQPGCPGSYVTNYAVKTLLG
jgi:hypothetical protein